MPQLTEKIWDIRERALAFAIRIVKLCQHLEHNTKVSKTLVIQLLKSGTSVGANLEEAQGGQSKADFVSKNSISLKEAREARYWLRLILASYDLDPHTRDEALALKNEAQELALILGSIIVKAKKQQ